MFRYGAHNEVTDEMCNFYYIRKNVGVFREAAEQSNKSNKFNLSIDISNKTAQELAH